MLQEVLILDFPRTLFRHQKIKQTVYVWSGQGKLNKQNHLLRGNGLQDFNQNIKKEQNLTVRL